MLCLQVEEKPSLPEHEPLSTSETVSDETVKEVRGPEYVRSKQSVEPALFTALKVRTPAVVHEVDQVLDQVELAEFGPAEWPLRELATIDILTRHGISTEQVIANRMSAYNHTTCRYTGLIVSKKLQLFKKVELIFN